MNNCRTDQPARQNAGLIFQQNVNVLIVLKDSPEKINRSSPGGSKALPLRQALWANLGIAGIP